ncbi:MAG: YARHG domain-containing protein [Roseivirga sp.]|nr:YARHG domain-containing protein [Roseivirga sp.]
MMFSSYNESYPEDLGTGKGVLVLPSYLEQLNLLDKTFYDDIILPRQVGSNAGTKTVELKNTKDISITDKIKSFFISVYEEGIDARGYHSESEELVVYNSQNNQLNSYQLYSLDDSDQLCRDSGYRVLFDSLIEVKKTGSHHGGLGYDFGPIYQYHTVSSEGDLIPLKSDRYFDFTKFAKVEKRHFEGCYAKEIGMMIDQHNYVQSDHLTIEELDLMRNEIFADYGYKFKTEKWQKYFATKAWYKPLHDDVNDLLTDIDKANVKTILRIKKSMEGREQDVVNKRPIAFYAAG